MARGIPTNESFLIGLVLMVQFVAFFGSLLFECDSALPGRLDGHRHLRLWVSSDGERGMGDGRRHGARAWRVAGAVALAVLPHDPAGHEAAFFGLYEISERGTSWIGPLIFGVVVSVTNSYRQAILSLIVLFIVGSVILLFTDTDRAIRDANTLTAQPGSAGETGAI